MARTPRSLENDNIFEPQRNELRQSASRGIQRMQRRCRSLENNVGSPSGSRASSIAGDRPRAGSGSQGRINLRRAQSYSEVSSDFSLPLSSRERSSSESSLGQWNTRALERPNWGPPILDYRKFEEEGRTLFIVTQKRKQKTGMSTRMPRLRMSCWATITTG